MSSARRRSPGKPVGGSTENPAQIGNSTSKRLPCDRLPEYRCAEITAQSQLPGRIERYPGAVNPAVLRIGNPAGPLGTAAVMTVKPHCGRPCTSVGCESVGWSGRRPMIRPQSAIPPQRSISTTPRPLAVNQRPIGLLGSEATAGCKCGASAAGMTRPTRNPRHTNRRSFRMVTSQAVTQLAPTRSARADEGRSIPMNCLTLQKARLHCLADLDWRAREFRTCDAGGWRAT